VNRPGQADRVIEFLDPTSDIAKEINKEFWVKKEVEKPKFRAKDVVSAVQAAGYTKFRIQPEHVTMWQQEDAKRDGKGYGVMIQSAWYWYQTWAIEPDLLLEASRHAGLRIGELDPIGPDPTMPTLDPALRIHQRDRMRRPRQIVPSSIPHGSDAPRPAAAAAARVPADAATLDPNRQPTRPDLAVTLRRHGTKPRHPQDPRTIASRCHRSSLVVCTSREDDTGWSGARGVALTSRPPSRPPTQLRSAQAAG
jgi:hypothetical protein